MKLNYFINCLSIGTCLWIGTANTREFNTINVDNNAVGLNGFIDYEWMNMIVNKTPVKNEACPLIEPDIYGDGFKVALEKSFYGNLSVAVGRWFPHNSQWASVGIGPIKNSFGVYYTEINKMNELAEVKEKKLPNSFNEIKKWKVSDSAYWESQGGLSFYLGTGITPVAIGSFMVATGGWANFLQKTGPNKVYVEISKKKIRSISLGLGVGIPTPIPISVPGPSVGIEKSFENAHGFAYEFVLDNPDNIEAFERFMDGDVTKAQNLVKITNSGVTKISDLSESRVGFSKSFDIETPFIPFIQFNISKEKAYDNAKEKSAWNEQTIKDSGIYIKQRKLILFGKKIHEMRSFVGGKMTSDDLSLESSPNHTEKLYGTFKFSYKSNWGQERRLRRYINKVKSLTGLSEETCAEVPSIQHSLGFNQVLLEVNWSDEYIKQLIGFGKPNSHFLKNIQSLALNYQAFADQNNTSCNTTDENSDDDNNDYSCISSSPEEINKTFANLATYSSNMHKSYQSDRQEFSKNLAKFGEEIWKSPFAFKAFYEKGKVCGEELKFEISGQRIARHVVNKKFINSAECESL